MNRKLIITCICLLLVLSLLAGWLFILVPVRYLRALNGRFSKIEKGMTAEQVEEIMGEGGRWLTESDPMAFWDAERLPESEDKRIRSTLVYSSPAFFLPIDIEFTFDEEKRVVGRNCLD